MELHVVSTEGIPEGCVLSVRAGSTRRQAPVAADRPFRFPTAVSEATPFKVDILEPIASARLIFRPGEERRTDCQYLIPLESASEPQDAPLKEKEEEEKKKAQQDPAMAVTIAVKPSEDKGDDDKAKASGEGDNAGDGSRPGSSTRNRRSSASSTSSRHGQASAAREYLDQHNLVEFTQLLVQSVIKEQPERPYSFMARQFFFPEPKPRTKSTAATSSAHPGRTTTTAAATAAEKA